MRRFRALVAACLLFATGANAGSTSVDVAPADRVVEIDDVWFESSGGVAKQLSYLPNFDKDNIEDWRAIAQYAHNMSYAAAELGKTRIVNFVLSPDVGTPVFSTVSETHANEIYAKLVAQKGFLLFQANPHGTFEEDFFETYKSIKTRLKEDFKGSGLIFVYVNP